MNIFPGWIFSGVDIFQGWIFFRGDYFSGATSFQGKIFFKGDIFFKGWTFFRYTHSLNIWLLHNLLGLVQFLNSKDRANQTAVTVRDHTAARARFSRLWDSCGGWDFLRHTLRFPDVAPPKRLNTTVQAPKLMFEVTKRSSGVTIHCASKRLTKLRCYENNHAQLKTTSSRANFWTWTSLWRWTLPLNCCSWVAAEQAEHFRNRRCT